MTSTTTMTKDETSGVSSPWGLAARTWGAVCGSAFAAGALAWAVGTFDLLGEGPAFESTAAGQVQDEARYFAALFVWNHETLWLTLLREGLFFVAFVALVPFLIAVVACTGPSRVAVRIGAALGALSAALGSAGVLVALVAALYWRDAGWGDTAPEVMVAVGRDGDALQSMTTWFYTGAWAVLALSMAHLAVGCRGGAGLPARQAPVVWALTAALTAMVLIGIGPWASALEGVWDACALAAGLVLAPWVFVGVGRHVNRSQVL